MTFAICSKCMQDFHWISHDDHSKGEIQMAESSNLQLNIKQTHEESFTIENTITLMKKYKNCTDFNYNVPAPYVVQALDEIGFSVSKENFIRLYHEQQGTNVENEKLIYPNTYPNDYPDDTTRPP